MNGNKIEIFEGKRAQDYDLFAEVWISNYQQFLQFLPPLFMVEDSTNILVAGCGTGTEIEVLATASDRWNITGVDPSPEMIDQARDKLNDRAGIKLITGLVSDLASTKMFDAATLLLVLHFIEDNGSKLALLQDIANRLNTNGLLVVYDIAGTSDEIKHNLQILKKTLPNDIPLDIVNKRLERIQNSIQHISENRFTELCEQAGFAKPIRFFQSTVYRGWVIKKL